MADKLNFVRYLSHFRCVHRGADFAKMRTTTVRRLLPESWGFLCPVHTPDGEPCGLMNHLTATCEVVTQFVYTASSPALLCNLGMWRGNSLVGCAFSQGDAVKLHCLGAEQRIPAGVVLLFCAGIGPTAPARALTGSQASDPLVHRPALNH